MNVFPVADGDTGDNMTYTMKAVAEELERINGRSVAETGPDEIVTAVARAALLGARGNSGVILSQIVRGAAEELVARRGKPLDPAVLSAAFSGAANAAYEAVREPVEGTMLTVIREVARRVAHDLARAPRGVLVGEDISQVDQDRVLAAVLEAGVETGEESVRRGPELLPILREAGVLDAGGVGVVVILRGVVAGLRGDDVPEGGSYSEPIKPGRPQHSASRYRYCTNFVLSDSNEAKERIAAALKRMGDSVLVVGEPSLMRIHIHSDMPEGVTAACRKWGEVSHLDVADMKTQIEERERRLKIGRGTSATARQCCAAVVVCSGDGMAALYGEFGARVVDGGGTLNPSTEELLAAIAVVDADEVVVLPNSANVILAAEQAAELSDKRVEVVASPSQQAGLACMVQFDGGLTASENASRLRGVLEDVASGAVAAAARDDPGGRFLAGDAVGFVDDRLVAWGDPESVLRAVSGELSAESELLTVIVGQDAPVPDWRTIEIVSGDVELDLHRGGQPNYWWLLTAE